MKTVEELANEFRDKNKDVYNSASDLFLYGFESGLNKAKEWISVEDELPEEGIDIVVKTFGVNPMACIYSSSNGYVAIWGDDNTVPFEPSHWKYID